MNPPDYDRGQVVVVEILLLLALLIIALGMYQAFGVPDQNKQVEFDHNQEVQSDLIDLRNALLDVRSSDQVESNRQHRSARVRLGTRYVNRIVGINPPDPQGTLRTIDHGNITIDGATVDGDFEGDPTETLLGTSHDTKTLVYEAGYSEYHNPPTTVLEHSLAYNQLEASNRSLTSQRVVQSGSTSLNIFLFDGDILKRGHQTTLDPETLDGPTAPVPITADGDSFDIVLPTTSPDVWTSDRLIGESFEEGEPMAAAEVTGAQEVTITVEDDDTWTLQMTRVGYDGGETDDTLSAIQPTDPGLEPGEQDPVYGPNVTINEDSISRTQGDDTIDLADDISGEISSTGSADRLRSGTPIQSVDYRVIDAAGNEYTSGVVATLDPDDEDAKRTWEFNELPAGTIDTDGWDEGEYEIEISAQDASGRVSEAEEADSFTITHESDFQLSDLEAPQSVSVDEEFDVSVMVENQGNIATEQVLALTYNGTEVGTQSVSVDPGESQLVTFEDVSIGTAGDYELTVSSDDDSETVDITVEESVLESVVATANSQGGQATDVDFDYTLAESQDIELRILDEEGGSVVGSTTVPEAVADEVNVEITDGDVQAGNRQSYPIWVEVEVIDTGEMCSGELTEGGTAVELCS